MSKPTKVYILEKIWMYGSSHVGSNTWAFNTFEAANKDMADDYRIEWDEQGCHDDDADGFYTNQSMPGDEASTGSIKFRNKPLSKIAWRIRESIVEGEQDEQQNKLTRNEEAEIMSPTTVVPIFEKIDMFKYKKYDTFKKYVRLSLDEYADDIAKNADNCLF